MASVEQTEWEECLLATERNREVERYLRKNLGASPPGMQIFGECPWILRFLIGANYGREKLAHTRIELADFIGLVVSQDNSCRYCFAEQRVLLRATGMSEDRIRRVEQDLATAEIDDREVLALEFARRLSRSNPLPGADDRQSLLAAGFSEPEVKEMIAVAAIMAAANRIVTLPALPPQKIEAMPDSWRMKIFGPVVRRVLQSRRKAGRPTTLPEDARSGPFSSVVVGLDGLPLAPVLRAILDDAWSSTILTPRAKALIVAVVARGIGAAATEAEASRILAETGMSEGELEDVLAHLSSSKLDAVEAQCVPFARETIRYRPAQIQRRGREVHEKLSDPQFLELIGMAALANMICRLELVTVGA